MSAHEKLVGQLLASLGEMTGADPAGLDGDTPFLDMGADSLSLLQISQSVQDRFGIKVPFRLLIDELTTCEALAGYLEARMPQAVAVAPTPPAAVVPEKPAAVVAPPAPPPVPVLPAAPEGGGLEAIVARQLDLMAQQIDLLRRAQAAPPQPAAGAPVPAAQPVPPSATGQEEEFVPHKPIRRALDQDLDPRQREHLAALIARVSTKTQGSKSLVERDRVHHADSRTVAGFRRLWKEISYPLVATEGYGGRIRDVDGNEYVDLTMGFGSLLFGHTPPFLVDTLMREVPRGVRLGPQSYLAGDVARLISELTGAERVTFCNSGTEAIMTALRLARARTGRHKVAIFAGSYHGTADEVLARAEAGEEGGRALPLAPGIPPSALADMVVFRYDHMPSLEALRRQAHELAAVLIEPPRSRTPDVHPVEFLRELRRMTEEHGAALIFDEVVTGFRTHPGGAQAIFGIHPDLSAYGKTVAAGMPIGIVAGKAEYMDAVDGGMWRFGDDSFPEAEMTFHAGTFCKHPYTMPVCKAVLEHLKAEGPALQERLTRRTEELVRELNDFFIAGEYPFKVVNFGSLFRFVYPSSLRLGELFYYHWLDHGVFVWEGRNCFLSTAHTEEDIAQIVAATKASVAAMREGGLLPPPEGGKGTAPRAEEPTTEAPLTEAQEQLWILTQLGAESSRAYNESMTLHLRGDLDAVALRRALEMVVARHEALRATFAPDGSHQRFTPPGPVDLPRIELPGGGGDRQARIAAWIAKEAGKVFSDLVDGPLYRARLLKVEEGWHLLVLTLHHLVTDGFSNGVVLSELAQLYGALAQGTTAEQAAAALPPAVPFSSFVARQREERQGPEMARAEAYWTQLFAAPPVLDLPTDRPRPPLQGHFGDRAYLTAGPELTARVKAFAREQGCTLFVTLLAAYQVLLHRLTGQDDLVAGTPAAGQLAAGGGPLVGYCVNLLPLRSRTSPAATVASFLKGVRGQVLDAFEHQVYPFQRLIKQIDLPRDPSRLPLVAVTFTTERAGRLPFAGLETEVVSNNNGGSKFELFLTVLETEDDELVFDAEYNSYLFDAATLRRWLGHLEQGLAAMTAEPRGRLLDLPLLGPAERHQALIEWNDTAVPYDRETLIHQLFEAQAERAPDAPAVAFEGERLTYGELNAEANRLAHYLASLGVERGRPVALLLRRSLAMVPALLGVLKAGGAYVPIDPGYPAERIHQLLASLAAPVVITQSSELPTLAGLRPRLPDLAQVIVLDSGADPAAWPATNLPPRAAAGDVAYVIFTSGSTGTPKGVVETHRPVINLIRWVNRTFGVGPADRVLFITSLGFDLSVYDLFGLLAAGGSIRVAAEGDLRDPERLIAWLAADGITFWDSAPTALQQLVPFLASALPGGSETHLRLIFQSGDWVPLTLPGQLRERFPGAQVVALGGATEATVWSNHHRVREIAPDWSSIPYGRPIANARYYVLGPDLGPVPLGVAGDLFIGGECLSSGYAGEPGLTAFRYLPDPYAPGPGGVMYRTGDRARFRGDGEIEFLGRLDDQVKVRGFRIELGEIEAVLARHPAVREAAVLARGDAGDRRLVAYVVPRAAAAPGIEELRAYLRERLPEHMVPAAFVPLAALPANANGKLDRKALPVPDPERPELAAGFEPPATPAEETLAAIWCQALGVARVGRHDGFFELGGDSILAVRIVAQARRAGLPLTPAHLFLSPTIAALAALPEIAVASGGEEEGGEVPLTPVQRWFFDRDLPRPQHYNQAMLLAVPADLSADVVERACGVLLRRHEALRMRYSRGPEGWRQRAAADVAGGAAIRCERVDLSRVAAAERGAAVTAACAHLQAGLGLERGPLVRVALLTLSEGEPGRLAIVAHHLAVDITSWRILLEDLAAACEQLRRGEAVTLKERTTPLRQWAERLAGYARSTEVERQIPFWTAAARGQVQPLPRDLPPAAIATSTEGSAREVAVELDEPATRALLREAPRAFRTLTAEVLLAALARALGNWTGENAVLVDLEGNGREVELSGVSLAHTVGWFTTLYPVLLELAPAATAGEAVRRIKEQLRAIPQEGLGYGLLRYGDRTGVTASLTALPPAEVSFLYVGGYVSGLAEAAGEGSGFALAAEPVGPASSPENSRSHLLEVFAEVRDERLCTVFTYSEDVHRRETVERLAADFLAALRSLLADLPGAVPAEPTPADFPQSDLTQDELDALLVHFGPDGD